MSNSKNMMDSACWDDGSVYSSGKALWVLISFHNHNCSPTVDVYKLVVPGDRGAVCSADEGRNSCPELCPFLSWIIYHALIRAEMSRLTYDSETTSLLSNHTVTQ